MKTACRTLLMLTLVALIAAPLAAQDAKKKKKGKGKRTPTVVQVPKGLELTAEQKTQVAAINKEYTPKFIEAQKALAGILTDEQKKARQAAFKANKEAKRKGKEARAALNAALALTDEQKKQYQEAQKAVQAIRAEARGKFVALLTPEQKKQIAPKRKPKAKKKPAKKPVGKLSTTDK